MRLSIQLAFVAAIILWTTAHVAADSPATRPAIPPLIAGSGPPASFIVDGIFRSSATSGVAFYVATDGRREVCAIYDPVDGTPLFFSDRHQTLVYDLANSRIVLVHDTRGDVRIGWNPNAEKPMSFNFGVDQDDPHAPNESNSWFRIDRFVDTTPSLKRIETAPGLELYAAQRKGGIESLQIRPGDASWFRFASRSGDESFYRIELEATRINKQIPDTALAFPDFKKLPPSIHPTELDQYLFSTFLVFLRDGRAWMAKLALAMGPEMQDRAKGVMPNADWDELRKRDAALGAAYRKALEEQGIHFQKYHVAPTPQPKHE